jgi:hypothetical protein
MLLMKPALLGSETTDYSHQLNSRRLKLRKLMKLKRAAAHNAKAHNRHYIQLLITALSMVASTDLFIVSNELRPRRASSDIPDSASSVNAASAYSVRVCPTPVKASQRTAVLLLALVVCLL